MLAQPFWLNDFCSTYEFQMNFYGIPLISYEFLWITMNFIWISYEFLWSPISFIWNFDVLRHSWRSRTFAIIPTPWLILPHGGGEERRGMERRGAERRGKEGRREDRRRGERRGEERRERFHPKHEGLGPRQPVCDYSPPPWLIFRFLQLGFQFDGIAEGRLVCDYSPSL